LPAGKSFDTIGDGAKESRINEGATCKKRPRRRPDYSESSMKYRTSIKEILSGTKP
jgi:hypothetical protein